MTLTAMLDKYRMVERVSEISTAKRDKEPEMQNIKPCQFEFVLKQEERAMENGKVPYVRKGDIFRQQTE